MENGDILFDIMFQYKTMITVADPGLPRGGGANPKGGRQPIIWSIFPENCMKMKKFWARGGRASLAPPGSATG